MFMKLAIDKITAKTGRYKIAKGDWCRFEGEDLSIDGTAEIAVCRRDSHTVQLTGTIAGQRATVCDRCGEQVRQELHCEFEYLVTTLQEEEGPEVQEVQCSDEEANTLYLEEPDIDVDAILREQAYLALPLRTLCSEDCKGICAGCGVGLNSDSCRCPSDNSDSPFAVLANLSNK